MNEEEKKAIEYLKLLEKTNIFYDKPPSTNRCNIGGAIYILLNLVEKQDKIIDLMSEAFQENLQTCPYDKYDEYLDCESKCKVETEIYKECWKKYFRKKVENE